MKVSILYASVGAGHKKAAEAVKEAINIKYPDATLDFIDGIDYSSKIVNKIVVKSYSTMANSVPAAWELFYNMSDKQSDGSLSLLNNTIHKAFTMRLKRLFRKSTPDVIVSTHPSLTKMSAYLKKKGKTDAKILVILTDYAVHSMWIKDDDYVDNYIVATHEMKKDMIDFGIDENKIQVSGIPVSQKFNETYDKKELYTLGLDPAKKTALFFCGGGLSLGKSTDMFKELLTIDKDFQVIAIAGKNEKNRKLLSDMAHTANKMVKVIGFTDEVPKLLNISDFVITKPGGLTSSECLTCMKPMIIINPIPGQEDKNANYFTNNGIALELHEGQKLERVVSILFDNPLRAKQLMEMCKFKRNVNASLDAASLIYKLYEQKINETKTSK